jgi:hypothetical protein
VTQPFRVFCTDRWPTQARFWLEWGCSHVTDIALIDELNCPHAMGTDTFSPQRADSLCHILLLPPPHSTPSLRSVAQGRLRLLTTDESRRIFDSALERVRRSYRLHVYGYVIMGAGPRFAVLADIILTEAAPVFAVFEGRGILLPAAASFGLPSCGGSAL